MAKTKKKIVPGERVAAGLTPPRSPAPVDAAQGSTLPTWIGALAVFAITWAVFQPALDGAWLRWDDDQLLLDREEWRGFSSQNLGWMFTTFHMGPYQPLSWLSYACDFAMHGLDPRGYHQTNIALHALSASFLFLAARELFFVVFSRQSFGLTLAASATALFWSLHPLRVESVAWITERRDCLSGVFFFLTLYAWLRFVRAHPSAAGSSRGRRRWYWIAVVAFAASLLSKGLGLALPLVLLLLDIWPLRRMVQRTDKAKVISTRTRLLPLILEKTPFLALSAAAAVVAVVGQKVTGAMVKAELHSLSARIVQSFYGLAFYVRKTIWPDDLMVLYPMSVPLDASELRFVVSITSVFAVTIALVIWRKRAPAAIIACAAYFLLVLPVLGLVQTGSQLVADRYSHLATVPLIVLFGGFLFELARRFEQHRMKRVTFALVVISVLSLVPLARATRLQIPVWRDTLSLWQHDLEVDPTDRPGRRNLMVAYEHEGRAAQDPARRRSLFERGLEIGQVGATIAPDAACAAMAAKLHDLLAGEDPAQRTHHLQLGLAQALRAIESVERTQQKLPEAYESAAVLLAELGRPAEALPHLAKLVAMTPENTARLGLYGEILMQAGRVEDALVPLHEARRIDPGSTMILLDLGDAYRRLGRNPEAVESYRRALEVMRNRLGPRADLDPEYQAAQHAVLELERAR